jgi:AcrR family transcriptional regulator
LLTELAESIGVANLMSISKSNRDRRGLPRGPHSLTPSEVAHSQRERLLAAMTAAVAATGYTATSVADVIERAGVSRKTFYVHFKDRRDCLSAAHELAAESSLERVRVAAQSSRSERDRLPAMISALCEVAAESPGGLRLQVAEIAGAGQAGLLSRERWVLSLGGLLRSGLRSSPSAPSAPLLTLIAGGLSRVVSRHTEAGQLDGGSEPLVRELTRWARSYHPSPAALDGGEVLPFAGAKTLLANRIPIGGRAPGTLSLTPRGMPESSRGVSPSLTAHSQRERILDAVTNLSAKEGYVCLTIDDIVAVAGVSLNTFYEHFKDKEDAFLVAHELGHMRAAAILEQALAMASSWDARVREGIAALLGFFFSEPAFARLAAIEAPIASPQIAARMQLHLDSYAQMLLDGAPRSRRPPPIADEAIGAALHAAVFAYAVRGMIRDPGRAYGYATYLVLAPFLGPNKVFAGA